MYSIHHFIKKILFPERCVSCKKEGDFICKNCLQALPLLRAVQKTHNYTEYVLFSYTHSSVKKIIWELKYKNNYFLRKQIIEHLFNYIKEYIPKNEPMNLISVPKSHDPTKKRDFDHGLLLATELCTYIKKYTDKRNCTTVMTDCLYKKTNTRQAAQKSRSERINGIHQQIEATTKLKSHSTTNSFLIIIDDVSTTGATRDEMIRVLRSYFSGAILFIALAH